MAYEKRDNSGTLFTNGRKEKDSHPDFTGTAMIDGKEYYISAWTKSGQKGAFYSLAFKPKEAKPETYSAGGIRQPAVTAHHDLSDEIPF